MAKDLDEIDFQSLPIKRVDPNIALPGSIYLFLNGHFVHYKSAGDSIPSEKYNLFIYRKMTHLFIKCEEKDLFDAWYENRVKKTTAKLNSEVGKGNEVLVDLRNQMKGDLYELFKEDITKEDVDVMMEGTRKIVEKALESNTAQAAMKKLINYGEGIADHSLNVAFLSVYLAQNLGYNHQIILENVYLGGLLHDFGKTRIDPKYFEDENSPNFDKAMLAHPELGKNTLMAKAEVPEEVLSIVVEHHERNDGKGYPKGIKGHKIYDLTKIVSIANSFFDFMKASNGGFQERKKKAIYLIENDKGHMFDPKKVESAVKVLKTLN